jgi:DNA-binding transcriptional LysR family regulator
MRPMHLLFQFPCNYVIIQSMNIRQLRAFAAIVDTGGFIRAADHVHLSQPALSRQIRALETELGVPLFDRSGHRVRLTAEGEDLLRHCRRVLTEIDSLGGRARTLKSGQTGVLRVGATPQVIESLLADFIRSFRSRHPGVDVKLVEEGGARLRERIEQGDVQIAIMPAGDEQFRSRTLYPMHLVAVLQQNHHLSGRRMIEVQELADEPLLRMDRGFASRTWFEAACQVAHVQPRALLDSASPQTMIELARTGYGIALLPSPMRLSVSGVSVVPVVHAGISIGKWAVAAWDPQRYFAPYAEQFVDELSSSVERKFPGAEFVKRAPRLPRPKDT